MLQTLREKTSGWIASVILGLLIIPFAFFGVNNYFEAQVETWVAKVGEKEIDQNEYRQRFDQYRQQMRSMLGESFDPQSVESAESKRRLLDAMVDEELLRQGGAALGLAVAPAQLQKEIASIQAFHVDGKFSPQQYKLMLATQGMSPLGFEARVREDLQARSLPNALKDSALVSTHDVDTYFRLRDQTRDLRVLPLKAPEPTALPEMTEQVLADYFKAHGDRYMSEEKVAIEYLIADASKIELPAAADEETLRQRYEEQKARFTEPAQRLASHILVKVAEDAPADAQQAAQAKAADIVAKARAEGADFAALAKELSDDVGSKAAGGDLGWIATGFADPAFETALFAMEPGKISDPVKTAEGWHVIQLREVRGGTAKPFEAVREQLAADYLETERERAQSELAGKLVDITYRDPSTLAVAAKELKLEVVQVEAFGRAGGIDPISQHPEVLKAAFDSKLIAAGTASDALDLGEGRTAIIRITEHQPSKPLALEDVREQAESDWQRDELARLASEQAEALLKRLQQGESLEDVAKDVGGEIASHTGVGRNAVDVDRQLVVEAFAQPRATDGKPMQLVVSVGAGGKALLEITKVEDGKAETVSTEERKATADQLEQAFAAAETRELLAALRKSIPVQIAEDRM